MNGEDLRRFDDDEVNRLKEYMVMTGSVKVRSDFSSWLRRVDPPTFQHAIEVSEGWHAGYKLGFASAMAGLGQDDYN